MKLVKNTSKCDVEFKSIVVKDIVSLVLFFSFYVEKVRLIWVQYSSLIVL